MKLSSFMQYTAITAMNGGLFFPVLFFPLLAVPMHLLIVGVSFDWLLKKQAFAAGWNKIVFAAIPPVMQLIGFLLWLFNDTGSLVIMPLFTDSVMGWVLLIVCIIEFGILLFSYSNYLEKQGGRSRIQLKK